MKLDKTDYTATSGTSIVLDSGASAGDILEILAFDTFGLFSGEFAQDVTVAGDLTVSGTTTTAATTMTGDLSIADKIVHTGDTNTAIRFADADTVTIETGGSERFRVSDAGDVAIGATPNTYSGFTTLTLGGPDKSNLDFETNGTLRASFFTETSTSDFNIQASSGGSLVFLTNGNNERLRMPSGGGITFNGDTAAENTLNDYEEGTWTPVYVGSSSSPTITYDIQVGSYRKIGKLVHLQFSLRTDSVSGGSGSVYIQGLPFAGATQSLAYYTGAIGYASGFTTDAPQVLHIGSGGSTIVLYRHSGSDANSMLNSTLSISNLTNSTNSNYLLGSLTYPTDA